MVKIKNTALYDEYASYCKVSNPKLFKGRSNDPYAKQTFYSNLSQIGVVSKVGAGNANHYNVAHDSLKQLYKGKGWLTAEELFEGDVEEVDEEVKKQVWERIQQLEKQAEELRKKFGF